MEANVANAIAEIRRVLGDDPKSPRYVCTVSRRGYRFCADAEALGNAPAPRARALRWWLTWKDTTLPLAEGENTVGRHPASDVWLNATSVSRDHARIVIGNGRAEVQDCGSTNGTFVDGTKVTERHPLVDGNAVTFGSEKTTFRLWSRRGSCAHRARRALIISAARRTAGRTRFRRSRRPCGQPSLRAGSLRAEHPR